GAEFKAIGLTSDFTLSWKEPAPRASPGPATLDATDSGILVRIDQHHVTTIASLTVRGFGREFESFRVRLPPGASLEPVAHQDYSVELVGGAADGAAAPDGAQWVEVGRKTKTKSSEPIRIQLTTRRLHEETTPEKPLELGGFEVLGAARQWGRVAIVADDDWQITFGKRLGMRQVEDLPDEELFKDVRADDLVASFEYYRQPFSLPVQIRPEETVVSVEPSYQVRATASRLDLDATLAYKISGAKAFSLEIDAPGWNIDLNSIGPAELIDSSRIASRPGMGLTIPLKQASTGKITLQLAGHREVAADAKAIEFELPRPKANTVGLAELEIFAAENVELTPRDADIVGLGRQQTGLEMPFSVRRETLNYRGDPAQAKFAADFRVNPR
ncbi:MAG TPA: hypothetical protein VFX03_16385, partial [Thermomicrobiales bacterium]|nr:hypothetical protein [Thermomicrobiales bacterium]